MSGVRLHPLTRPGEWVDDALCAQTDPELFFPEKGGNSLVVKRICAKCQVKDQCLEWALTNNEKYGIWGGTSEHDRRKLKRKGAA